MPKTMATEALIESREENRRILNGVTQAVRRAVLEHKRAGRAVPTLRDDKVVWIPAEEIDVPDPDSPAPE